MEVTSNRLSEIKSRADNWFYLQVVNCDLRCGCCAQKCLQSIVEALDLIGVNDWRSLAFVTKEKSVVFTGRINGLIVHNIKCNFKIDWVKVLTTKISANIHLFSLNASEFIY